VPEARCAMRSERSRLRLTVNGVREGRRESPASQPLCRRAELAAHRD
jgi:hypothetical protein